VEAYRVEVLCIPHCLDNRVTDGGEEIQRSPILVTLNMEAVRTSETSVLTRATLRNIPEDGILHSHRRENLKSYVINLPVHSKCPLTPLDRIKAGKAALGRNLDVAAEEATCE
jgi:hypothetical protein